MWLQRWLHVSKLPSAATSEGCNWSGPCPGTWNFLCHSPRNTWCMYEVFLGRSRESFMIEDGDLKSRTVVRWPEQLNICEVTWTVEHLWGDLNSWTFVRWPEQLNRCEVSCLSRKNFISLKEGFHFFLRKDLISFKRDFVSLKTWMREDSTDEHYNMYTIYSTSGYCMHA